MEIYNEKVHDLLDVNAANGNGGNKTAGLKVTYWSIFWYEFLNFYNIFLTKSLIRKGGQCFNEDFLYDKHSFGHKSLKYFETI